MHHVFMCGICLGGNCLGGMYNYVLGVSAGGYILVGRGGGEALESYSGIEREKDRGKLPWSKCPAGTGIVD